MYSRALVYSDYQGTALENAWRVIGLEQAAGIFWEPAWQRWAVGSADAVVVFFNLAYIFTFLPIIALAAVTLYVADRSRYRYYRNVTLFSFVLALLAFMLFPLAPPRMIDEFFIDTIKVFGPSGYASREFANYYNAYASMPSLHFSWALMFGVMFLRTPMWWIRLLGVIYPAMTLFAITVTANHYIVDAVGGGLLIAASFLSVELCRRLPPALSLLPGSGRGYRGRITPSHK